MNRATCRLIASASLSVALGTSLAFGQFGQLTSPVSGPLGGVINNENPLAIAERGGRGHAPGGGRPHAPAIRPQAPAARPQAPAVRPQAPAVRPQAPAIRPQVPAARPQLPGVQRPQASQRPAVPPIQRQPDNQPNVQPGRINRGQNQPQATQRVPLPDRIVPEQPRQPNFRPADPNNPVGRRQDPNVGRRGLNRIDRDQGLGGTRITIGNRDINLAGRSFMTARQRHPHYYSGYWNGNYGRGGWNNRWRGGADWGFGYGGPWSWYGRPLGWGLGGWGLGVLAYTSGYLGYYNPYYSGAGYYDGYNYAQPITVFYDTATVPAYETAESLLDAAVVAFQHNDFDRALDLANRGIALHPGDSVLHEFRALVLFAKGDYQQAASTIHAVVAVGPGWNWETMRQFYVDTATYTTHLRALEEFTRQNPEDAGSRFVLAYHYLAGGYQDAAVRQLHRVVDLMPQDQVAANLLRMLQAPPPDSGSAATPLPQPAQPAPDRPADTSRPSIDPAAVLGTWMASRDDGSKFHMTLNKDGTFVWKFSRDESTQQFSGKYTLEGTVLALERDEGGSLIADVRPDASGKLRFKLLGGPEDDPGLIFHH